jgi:predicted nuclease of predicted toxin-antitoxin system
MLNLYLDANTPEDLARALRAEGFEVVRAQEVGLQDADDLTHLRWASEHGYALFTFDTKTMPKAIEAWGKMGREHFGVILCEQMPREAVGVIVRRLKRLAQVYRPEALKNVTVYLGAVWDEPDELQEASKRVG